MSNIHKILQDILSRYDNHSKWNDAPFGRIKRVSNSHVGSIGQDFVEELCKKFDIKYSFPMVGKKRASNSPWDIKILGITFEIKTATEDISNNFQFNHIRHHREYDCLLCLGIAPDNVFFDVWRKGYVMEGKAGRLVTMDKGSSATFKLTKKAEDMRGINKFEDYIRKFIKNYTP